MNEKKLIIIGAGALAREVMFAALEDAEKAWRPAAFVVDGEYRIEKKVENLDVLAFEELEKFVDDDTYFINGIGNIQTRVKLSQRLKSFVPSANYATVIHRSAVVMPFVTLEEGVFLAPHATIATRGRISRHALVNQNVSIGHDCIIGEYSIVSPCSAVSGFTCVGEKTFLGSGVVTYPNVKIGANCTVSAGAVVTRNLADGHKQILKPNTMILKS